MCFSFLLDPAKVFLFKKKFLLQDVEYNDSPQLRWKHYLH